MRMKNDFSRNVSAPETARLMEKQYFSISFLRVRGKRVFQKQHFTLDALAKINIENRNLFIERKQFTV